MYGTRLEKQFDALANKGITRIKANALLLKSRGDKGLQESLGEVAAKSIKEIIGKGLEKDLLSIVRHGLDSSERDKEISAVFDLAHIAINKVLTVLDAKSGKSWIGGALLGGGEEC